MLLFLIIFFWTPPHFWALALYRARRLRARRRADAAGGRGRAETRRQILLYTLILAPLGASPWLLGYCRPALWHRRGRGGAAIVALALRIYRNRAQAIENAAAGDAPRQTHAASKQLFAFSILYLFLLFAVLLVDRLAGRCSANWAHDSGRMIGA